MNKELKDGVQSVLCSTRSEWRMWLQKNHTTQQRVWLMFAKKGSAVHNVSYSDAVEEALCFGWIDSKSKSRDTETYYQYFSQRKPKSNWTKTNKQKAEQLIEQDLMTPAGYHAIAVAKQNGYW